MINVPVAGTCYGAEALLAIRCPTYKLLADRAYDAASLRETGSSSEEQSHFSRPIPRANTRTVTTETPIAAET
jgi:hypothetical protein